LLIKAAVKRVLQSFLSLDRKPGGRIVAEGTPEELTRIPPSYTGLFLTKVLNLS
jgi:hypothetical protein